MYKLTNRNHYYNSNGMNNDPARTKRRGYHREKDNRISERIYNPGFDTSREYNKGDRDYYNYDSDIYENEFINDNNERDYDFSPERRRRDDNDDGFFHRVGENIKHAWENLRHHDDPDTDEDYYYRTRRDNRRRNNYIDPYEREYRRQRTQYYSDNDFDSVYNAEDENSYLGYERRNSPYDYQDEFDNRFNDREWGRNYNSVNNRDYDNYERGRNEFDSDRRRSLRKRRVKYSMDL